MVGRHHEGLHIQVKDGQGTSATQTYMVSVEGERMKTYLLIFDYQSKLGWSYTHSSVPVMAESPQEAVRILMESADRTNQKVLKVDVYEKLETPSGGWLESNRTKRVEYDIDSFGIAGRRRNEACDSMDCGKAEKDA